MNRKRAFAGSSEWHDLYAKVDDDVLTLGSETRETASNGESQVGDGIE